MGDLFEPGLQLEHLRATASIKGRRRAAAVRTLGLRENRAVQRVIAIDELQYGVQIALREPLWRVEPRWRT